jgi:oxalate decarboxylase
LRRREFIAAGSAAAVAAAAAGATVGRAEDDAPQPVDGDLGATILGPRNEPLERQNPDLLLPPRTDAGSLPNLKFAFDAAHMRVTEGGWTRQVTVRELPVATTLAGVGMRLKPGGIRELHWHESAEWSVMLAGRARITAIDPQGRNFAADVGAGDLWAFPAGVPHSIQGLEEGAEFLLVFDDGSFSEFDTFQLTDWIAHTPRSVLAKNFGVPESAFDKIPADIESRRYIFPAKLPGPLRDDAVRSPQGTIPDSYAFPASKMKATDCPGGRVRILDSTTFKPSKTIAVAIVDVEPGGMRELHWHPNADEWQYYISGQARMTVFGASGAANTFDYQAGDVGYVPFPMGHYVENTGQTTLRFLELFKTDRYADVSLNQWLALTPHDLVRDHLPVDNRFISALDERKPVVVRY